MHFGTIIFTAEFLFVTLASNLETAYEWRHVDYLWPSSGKRQEAIRSGNYEIGSPVITDVDVSEDKRVFVSLTGSQVPARLAVVTNHVGPSGPLLKPYPNWNWTDKNDCNCIITPSRIEIDNCNRLWIIDSAQTGMKKKHCEPKLLAFDLGTDKLITKVEIPEDVAININTNRSLFTNIRVETHGEFCEMTTVYMADSFGMGLVIWDQNRLYRIENPSFEPRPHASHHIDGNNTEKMHFGIHGMDISPKVFPDEPQFLYYRPFSSFGMYAASTDHLRNSIDSRTIEIFGEEDVLGSQSYSHSFSSDGTLFFGTMKEILVCWNRYRKFIKENIVTLAKDDKGLPYVSGIKVIPEKVFGEEQVWLITNRVLLHNAHTNRNPKEINFRILRSPVKKLITKTKCEMPFETRYELGTMPGHLK